MIRRCQREALCLRRSTSEHSAKVNRKRSTVTLPYGGGISPGDNFALKSPKLQVSYARTTAIEDKRHAPDKRLPDSNTLPQHCQPLVWSHTCPDCGGCRVDVFGGVISPTHLRRCSRRSNAFQPCPSVSVHNPLGPTGFRVGLPHWVPVPYPAEERAHRIAFSERGPAHLRTRLSQPFLAQMHEIW